MPLRIFLGYARRVTTSATDAPHGNGRIAAFFDLDKTIIATSSASAFSRPFYKGGLITKASAVRSAYAHFLFMVGGANADQTERMRAQLSSLVTGWPVEMVSAIVSETLHQYIDPYVYGEALELIAQHKALGHDVIIVSASGAELVYPIAALLDVDHAIATRMEIVDGRYTGSIDFYAYGENKATAVKELAASRGYNLDKSFAYSDSITDVPMLESVGNPSVVNADRTFRKFAVDRGWDILSFQKPVALKKSPAQSKFVVLGAALVLTVAVALAIRATRTRRNRTR